jgi:hypothetical protein
MARRPGQEMVESSPIASACTAMSRISGQVGGRPGPSEVLMGRMTPIRMS